MRFQRDDIFTGLFVLIGSLLGLGTLLALLGYNVFENRIDYVLRMRKISGVKKGTLVKLKDYSVGKVTEVTPIYGASIYFKAILQIDRDLILYRGTKINITKQNVIGDTVLELFPSFQKKQRLKAGDTLFATSIVNLDQMINQISKLVGNVGNTVGEIGKMAGSSRRGVKLLLKNLNLVLERTNRVLARSENNIIETMQNMAATTATLKRISRRIEADPLAFFNKARGSGSTASTGSALP